MKDLGKYLIERIRAELKLCQIQEIDEAYFIGDQV